MNAQVQPQALAALHGECFTVPRPWSADEFAILLGAPGVFLHIYPQCDYPQCDATSQPLAGFVLGRAVADEAELLTLAVASSQRRCGIGHRLVEAFLQQAALRGARSVFLEVAGDNEAARHLYQKCGFEQRALRRGYYRGEKAQSVDGLILGQNLPQTGP